MSLGEVLITSGGTAVVVGTLAAISVWLLKSAILKRMDAELAKIESGFRRVERLEADLFQLRAEGYGEIWTLTGKLNLFGTELPVDSVKVSDGLTKWYFERGQILTKESKKRYFLAQEVLGLARLRALNFERPDDEVLYTDTRRTVDVLDELREQRLELELIDPNEEYELKTLENSVAKWKKNILEDQVPRAVDNWLLLQFLLSALRSRLITELKIR